MKSLIAATVAALTMSAALSTAQADTITVHGVWDKIWAEKSGK